MKKSTSLYITNRVTLLNINKHYWTPSGKLLSNDQRALGFVDSQRGLREGWVGGGGGGQAIGVRSGLGLGEFDEKGVKGGGEWGDCRGQTFMVTNLPSQYEIGSSKQFQ